MPKPPPQDFNATAAYFERRAKQIKDPAWRADLLKAAAEYREKAAKQAKQRKRDDAAIEAAIKKPRR